MGQRLYVDVSLYFVLPTHVSGFLVTFGIRENIFTLPAHTSEHELFASIKFTARCVRLRACHFRRFYLHNMLSRGR